MIRTRRLQSTLGPRPRLSAPHSNRLLASRPSGRSQERGAETGQTGLVHWAFVRLWPILLLGTGAGLLVFVSVFKR